jgi:peptidoglycan/LPS O-acetylase OafA/YrhL
VCLRRIYTHGPSGPVREKFRGWRIQRFKARAVRDHLYPLDALRFIAALSVVSYHLGFFGWASQWGATPSMLHHAARYVALAPFTWFGWVGVEIFFVISGFVIAQSAYGRPPLDFLKGRLLRLYPAAWICATITLLAWLIIGHQPISMLINPYLRSISLWVLGPWIDGVYWSLAVEVTFYTIVLATLMGARLLPLTALPYWLVGLSILHFAAVALPDAIRLPALNSAWLVHADELLAKRACFFAAGIWLWQIRQKTMTWRSYLGLAIAMVCGLGEISEHAHQEASALSFHMALPVWLPLSLWSLAFCLVAAVARAPHLFEVRSPRAQAVFTRIGLMTYPLFLVHDVVGAGVIRIAVEAGLNQWAALVLAIVVALTLAFAICAVLEVEVRRWLRVALNAGERVVRGGFGRSGSGLR